MEEGAGLYAGVEEFAEDLRVPGGSGADGADDGVIVIAVAVAVGEVIGVFGRDAGGGDEVSISFDEKVLEKLRGAAHDGEVTL